VKRILASARVGPAGVFLLVAKEGQAQGRLACVENETARDPTIFKNTPERIALRAFGVSQK
jgi:hypothetical protein